MSVFSLTGWIVAGGAVMLLLCSSMLIFIAGYTAGESACGQGIIGPSVGALSVLSLLPFFEHFRE